VILRRFPAASSSSASNASSLLASPACAPSSSVPWWRSIIRTDEPISRASSNTVNAGGERVRGERRAQVVEARRREGVEAFRRSLDSGSAARAAVALDDVADGGHTILVVVGGRIVASGVIPSVVG
jgi:hypothetical protein